MSVTIKLRGDTEANWQAANPVLADREVALSTDKLNFKVGDGATAWASLGYWLPDGLLQIATTNNDGTDPPTLRLSNNYNGSQWVADSVVALLAFYSADASAAGAGDRARIEMYTSSVAGAAYGLKIKTDSGSGLSTLMTIGGQYKNVGIDTFTEGANAPRLAVKGRGSAIQSWLNSSSVEKASIEDNGNLIIKGAIQLEEMTPPAAPAANNIRLYAKDNGSGKTQLCVKFSDGTETILATQP